MKIQRYFFSLLILTFPAIVFYESVRILSEIVLVRERNIKSLNGSTSSKQTVRETITIQSKLRHVKKLTTTVKPRKVKKPQRDYTMKELQEINRLLTPPVWKKVNCSKLFIGDTIQEKKLKAYNKKFPYKHVLESAFMNATNHCVAYKVARKYVMSVSKEEQEFPLAYSITIHKHLDQFERLLRVIYRPNNFYCIHVDRKSGPNFLEAVKSIAKCFKNVFIASKLEIVVYAGFTRLQADLNCMKDLYEKYKTWKYLLNIAGTELPLKSNHELVQILKLHKGQNIIGKNNKTSQGRWKKRYSTNIFKNMTGKIRVVNKKNHNPPFKLRIMKGSAYAIFSRAMIRYVLYDPIPIKFLEWCRSTFSPDEHFWATLNDLEGNPHLKTPGGNSSPGTVFVTRAVLWFSSKCRGKNVRHICQYGVGNLPWLADQHEFVANKFDLETDHVAFQCMEDLLLNRSMSKVPWDIEWHQRFVDEHSLKNFTSV